MPKKGAAFAPLTPNSLLSFDGMGDCSICFESMEESPTCGIANTFTLPCQHRFHAVCLARWLYRKSTPSCPMCRCQPAGEADSSDADSSDVDDSDSSDGESSDSEALNLDLTIADFMRRDAAAVQSALRRASGPAASLTLRRTARLYRKWKAELVATRRELRLASREVQSARRVHVAEQRLYETRYREEARALTERQRSSISEITQHVQTLRARLRRQTSYKGKYHAALLAMS